MFRIQCRQAVEAIVSVGKGATDYRLLAALDCHLASCPACQRVCLRFIHLEALLAEIDEELPDEVPEYDTTPSLVTPRS
jgi:hypothetical protein